MNGNLLTSSEKSAAFGRLESRRSIDDQGGPRTSPLKGGSREVLPRGGSPGDCVREEWRQVREQSLWAQVTTSDIFGLRWLGRSADCKESVYTSTAILLPNVHL